MCIAEPIWQQEKRHAKIAILALKIARAKLKGEDTSKLQAEMTALMIMDMVIR